MGSIFHVFIEQDEDGVYVGRVPRLKGCVSQGDTVEELLEHMREAIALCLEVEQPDDTRFIGVEALEVIES